MPRPRESIRLEGFNNLTKVVSFNLYDFAVARTEAERASYVAYLAEHFSGSRITAILSEIARIIDAEVLNVSAQDYDPYGASALVLMSDLAHGEVIDKNGKVTSSVAAHLTKSHICAHTYPDILDPRGLCTFRVDIDIANLRDDRSAARARLHVRELRERRGHHRLRGPRVHTRHGGQPGVHGPHASVDPGLHRSRGAVGVRVRRSGFALAEHLADEDDSDGSGSRRSTSCRARIPTARRTARCSS